MTLFDAIVLLILVVSIGAGLARGAIQEVANVASFVVAVFVAIFALRYTGPIAVRSIHPSWAANAVAVVAVFLIAYLLFRMIAGMLTRTVHQAKALGTLDRLIGAAFGLVRGLVLLGVITLLLSFILPPPRMPVWITNAKSYPLAQASATALRALGPKGSSVAASLKPAMDRALGAEASSASTSSGVGQSADSGYSAAARKGLDDVVEKSR